MRKIIVSLIVAIATTAAFAQNQTTPMSIVSPDSGVVYRLFSTQNIYTFIKLNTRNGQLWQVQWGMDKDHRFECTLGLAIVKENEEKTGRFFLYPTSNIYTFILVDQIDGRTWQVQWGKGLLTDRWVIPIPFSFSN